MTETAAPASEPDPTQSPIFRQRAVEAKILRHVYETLLASHGEAIAKKTIADAVRAASIEQAGEMADAVRADGREPSMTTFQETYELWSRGGALEIEVLAETEDRLDFDVVIAIAGVDPDVDGAEARLARGARGPQPRAQQPEARGERDAAAGRHAPSCAVGSSATARRASSATSARSTRPSPVRSQHGSIVSAASTRWARR